MQGVRRNTRKPHCRSNCATA
eukprot:jgi/Chlat1/6104/Chrsp40S05687